jgi:large subunit ribosomal protein L25
VAEGGIAEHSLHTIQVEVLPLEVPDRLVLDVSEMQIGDVKRAVDLLLPAGVELIGDPEAAIVSIVPPTVELEAVEGAAVAEEEAQGATAEEARETVAGAEAATR